MELEQEELIAVVGSKFKEVVVVFARPPHIMKIYILTASIILQLAVMILMFLFTIFLMIPGFVLLFPTIYVIYYTFLFNSFFSCLYI